MPDGLETRVAKVEGEVSHIARRMDNVDNWLRGIVGLQVTTLIAVITALIRLSA